MEENASARGTGLNIWHAYARVICDSLIPVLFHVRNIRAIVKRKMLK